MKHKSKKRLIICLCIIVCLVIIKVVWGKSAILPPSAETCCVALLPQWFGLPSSGESHCSGINDGVLREQSLDVLRKSVSTLNGVKPISNVTELGIKLIWMDVPVQNPRQSCPSWQYGHDGETTVPNTGMMGTFVSQDCDACQPTAQNEMLGQSQFPSHKVFCHMVREVGVELGQSAKCQDFKRFPRRREFRSVIFGKVLRNEILLGALNLPTDMCYVGLKTFNVLTEIFVCEPKRTMNCREMTNHPATSGDFYLQDCIEDELFQLCVETINSYNVAEMRINSEMMAFFVDFHRPPIICQSEITCPVKDSRSLRLVLNDKPSLFQGIYLLCEGKNLFRVFYKKAKSRPVALPIRGRVPGSIECKGTAFTRNVQMILQKSA